MANVDITRIAGNIAALNSLYSLQNINNQLSIHQARLSTGKQLMSAADDPAGMSIASGFDIRRQGMKSALDTIGNAKNLTSTMEGGLVKIEDIMVKMRNKALEATGNVLLGQNERVAIYSQLKSFRDEINDVVTQTKWNGNALLGASGSSSNNGVAMTFLTDADGGVTSFQFTSASAGAVSINNFQGFYSAAGAASTGSPTAAATISATDLGLSDAALDVVSGSGGGAVNVMQSITNSLDVVKSAVSQIGAFTARLTFKEEGLMVAHANTEAAFNRIMNANMAAEQVEVSKLSILQQTATTSLAQANVGPQFLLQLFR
jgi:flagellin